MPQNDADRIARQRAQQQQDQEAVAQRAKEAQARATQQSLIQQIEAEIPITLRWLADHNYPRVVEVSIRFDNPIKRWAERPDTKAGWVIGEYEYYDNYDIKRMALIYLLSDGRIFAYGFDPTSPGTYFSNTSIGKHLQQCLDGIRKLRS